MNIVHRTRLAELKIKASILLKDLQGEDVAKAEKAAKRLLKLPFLKEESVASILSKREDFRLKHSQALLAVENDCNSWDALRNKVILEDCTYSRGCGAFTNIWIANYEEAKQYHTEHGGYLLRFRKDFVICEKEYIEALGLGEMQEEWKAIGYNWVEPKDQQAWNRLFEKAKENYLNAC